MDEREFGDLRTAVWAAELPFANGLNSSPDCCRTVTQLSPRKIKVTAGVQTIRSKHVVSMRTRESYSVFPSTIALHGINSQVHAFRHIRKTKQNKPNNRPN
jgi:hypothetical protein